MILVEIRISCIVYCKQLQGFIFLMCNELFAIGMLTMFLVVWMAVKLVNIVFQNKNAGRNVEKYTNEFKSWCNLLNIHTYIDDTHIETLNHIVLFKKIIIIIKVVDIIWLHKKYLIIERYSYIYLWLTCRECEWFKHFTIIKFM